MKTLINIPGNLRGSLIVSCQAFVGSPFNDSTSMARFAKAAVQGGAQGIRANGPEDIGAIRSAVNVPIVGIWKRTQSDGEILITPSLEDAQALVKSGAHMIALDCTARGLRYGALDRLHRIRTELRVPVLADIATLEEAIQATEAGADAVLSTLRGYTSETCHVKGFEPSFISELVHAVKVPVIAEGQIQTTDQVRAAFDAGAFAIIIGAAITRPEVITQKFVGAMEHWVSLNRAEQHFIGIDMGGTSTKVGLVSTSGELLFQTVNATPWNGGRKALQTHLERCVSIAMERAQRLGTEPKGIGLATAGWPNPASGEIAYATENLPDWTGANPGEFLHKAFGLPVAVENDANALAIAEKQFGAAKDVSDFVCLTLGTGVGGGCYVGGALRHGVHFIGNTVGHITVVPEGRPCTCGNSGCLEVYTNAAALMRYANGTFANCEEIIAAANSEDQIAKTAIETLAIYLALGCSSIVNLLDPELLILGGGLAQNNSILITALNEELAKRVTAWSLRRVRIQTSALGYTAGVLGAAAAVWGAIVESSSAMPVQPVKTVVAGQER